MTQPKPSSPPNKPTPKQGVLDIAPYVGGQSKLLKGAKANPGVRVVKLSSNETPLGASPLAIKAYAETASYLHRYPDGNTIALREAIAEVQNLPMAQLACGAGSDELIAFLINGYTTPGDEILYSQYGFIMYKIYAQAAGCTPVTAPEKNYKTDVDAILAAVTPRTKIVFIANPNNPTGSYLTATEMKRLHAGLPTNVILAIDGAYSEYATEIVDYSDGRELVASSENTIMLRTFSKIHGLSSLRVGWAYGPPDIIDVINRIRGPFNICGPGIAAASAAMRDTAYADKTRAFNTKWLAWLTTELTKLGLHVYPSITNFLMIEFPPKNYNGGKHSAANANLHLMELGLIVREVAAYGLPDCLRISIGLEEDNKAVIAALTDFLKS